MALRQQSAIISRRSEATLPAITRLFGILLVIVGVGGYVLSGRASFTALIPAILGAVLWALAYVAREERWRAHAMHAAAVVALLGVLGTAPGLMRLPALLGGSPVARPLAVVAQSLTALLLLVFLALCVRSFADARRRRTVS
jgi:hypothetical protein